MELRSLGGSGCVCLASTRGVSPKTRLVADLSADWLCFVVSLSSLATEPEKNLSHISLHLETEATNSAPPEKGCCMFNYALLMLMRNIT